MPTVDYRDEEGDELPRNQYDNPDGSYSGPLSPWEQANGNTPFTGNLPTDGGSGGGGGASFPSSVPRDWAEDFIRRNPGDYSRIESAYQSNNMDERPFDSQSSFYDQKTNKLTAQGEQMARLKAMYGQLNQPFGTMVPGQFTDPIGSWIEQFAQQRAQTRENPPSGSGQDLLENALRDISAQFQSGGFTQGEQETYQTQALDPLEQLRATRKRQVIEDLSRRGIAPQSGVAVQMMQDVDRQFDGLRTSTQRNLSAKFADEKMARLLQSLQLLGGLAGTENQRLNEAFQYRTVPLNLADRSFNQAFQMYQSANPLSSIGPMLNLAQLQQGRNDNSQEMLGYLAYILANS